MHYIHSMQSQLRSALTAYIDTLKEAFSDINTFLDHHLESDDTSKLVIISIVLTPIIGILLFIAMVMLTA